MREVMVAGFVALVLALSGCAPDPSRAPPLDEAGPPVGDMKAQAVQMLKATLKDPYSVVIESVSEPQVGHCRFRRKFYAAWYVTLKYNAKNSYGGYVGLREATAWFMRSGGYYGLADPWMCPLSFGAAK